MGHDHDHHDHHAHHHHHGMGDERILGGALALTLAFAAVEAAGGVWSGSLALLSDAGHMLSDSVALGLALFAAWIARRPPSLRHSYGFMRAEVLAALLNGVTMLLVIAGIGFEAGHRLMNPVPVSGAAVMTIATLGLFVNVGVAWLLSHGQHSINTRAALIHVLGDLLGSVAALVAGAVVHFTGWSPIDPLLSLFVVALILVSTVRLVRDALHVLMEGVPPYLKLDDVAGEIGRMPGISSVHDLHVWTLSSGRVVLSAHLRLDDLERWQQTLAATQKMLQDKFAIGHVTLQPEVPVVQPYTAAVRIHPK